MLSKILYIAVYSIVSAVRDATNGKPPQFTEDDAAPELAPESPTPKDDEVDKKKAAAEKKKKAAADAKAKKAAADAKAKKDAENSDDEDGDFTLEDLKALARKVLSKGNGGRMKEILKEAGYSKVRDVSEEDFGKIHKSLSQLLEDE